MKYDMMIDTITLSYFILPLITNRPLKHQVRGKNFIGIRRVGPLTVWFYVEWGNGEYVIPCYCSVLSRRIIEIDRRNIAKVRDFTIIIDEGGIINAVIAVEHVYTVM